VRRRLDAELVRRGLVPSRTRASEVIHAGRVTVGGAPATSPARQVAPSEPIAVAGDAAPYVSRGGVKLAGALDAFAIDVAGRHCLDAGASTGGFTDCLLQRGAAKVVAVDVGRGQLAWSLRTDRRVEVRDQVNARDLRAGDIDPAPDLVAADLSFISLRTVAPALLSVARVDAEFVVLIKPQFEAGRARVGKGGVVRDAAVRRDVVEEVVDGLAAAGLGTEALVASPIRGADGNLEFLAHARRGERTLTADSLVATVASADADPGAGEWA
jgi:23S rRNA (cytidine1920-2'-O)/16S rRNA (cytidine1409-2'-O)-methyltransferase